MFSYINDQGISDQELQSALERSISGRILKKVLLIPPDATRSHSFAGKITKLYYNLIRDHCHVDIMPALGTHQPMSEQECSSFLDVPFQTVIPHNWRYDVVGIGEISKGFVKEVSRGLISEPITIEINKRLLDSSYDLIISIGQVVPHEVVGMANYSKNIFVGCGGQDIINKSHMLGAYYGIERILGQTDTPVRSVLDYAEKHFISHLPIQYVLTVTTQSNEATILNGLFIGRDRELFEEAAKLSRHKNITIVDKPIKKIVVNLNEKDYKSMWLGNKAIYRTRMAIADGGELIILAKGVKRFGEDMTIDYLIKKYGYVGRERILSLVNKNTDLRDNLSAAAHLIHGSPEGRFLVTYVTDKMTKQEIESVGFKHMSFTDALMRYKLSKLHEGYNTIEDGSQVYYISNPALGLWADKQRYL